MKHIQYEDWLCYIANELDESTRATYEAHLYSCDHCLKRYMRAVEAYEHLLPDISAESRLRDKIMNDIAKENRDHQSPKPKQRPFYKQVLFHYAIAVMMTLVLMSAGLFSQLTEVTSAFEKTTDHRQNNSLTEQLIEKTFVWMDTNHTIKREADDS